MCFLYQTGAALALLAILGPSASAAAQAQTVILSDLYASAPYPLTAGRPVAWTAVATADVPVEYRFYLYKRTHWVMVRDYETDPKYTWIPNDGDEGDPYSLQVWARAVGSTAAYEAVRSTTAFAITAPAIDVFANVDFPTPPDNPVTWTARVPGADSSHEYQFRLFDQTSGTWSTLREYAAGNQAHWTPTMEGTHAVEVRARQVGNSVDYELKKTTTLFTVSRTPDELTGIFADTTFPAQTGRPITWTARPKGGEAGPLRYLFAIATPTGQIVASSGTASDQGFTPPYGLDPTFTWTPSWDDEGEYLLGTRLVHSLWSGPYFWYGPAKVCCVWTRFSVQRPPLILTTSTLFPTAAGSQVTWTVDLPDPTVRMEYQFWIYEAARGAWTVGRPYDENTTFTWVPSVSGKFAVQLWARRVGSTAAFEMYRGTSLFEISEGPVEKGTLFADVSLPTSVGTPITWTASARGGTAPLEYQFWRRDSSGWVLAQPYSLSNQYTWTPAAQGEFALQVWVRSSGSTDAYEVFMSSGVLTIHP